MARNLRKLDFAVLCFVLVTYETSSLPHKWYTDSEASHMHESQIEPYVRTKISDNIHTQRKILSKGNYGQNGENIAGRTDGKIIFPSDDMDNGGQSHQYVPTNSQPHQYIPTNSQSHQYIPSLKPTCENSSFCEYSPDYPNELVETALRMNKDLKPLAGIDLVPDVVHRVNAPPEDSSLCDSTEKIVYPKVAQSKDKEWLFVVNQGDFTQGVRVETCGKEDSVCNVIDGFAEGYKTICKQKYIYRQLVAVSSVGQIKPEMFRFPASCCCHIKFTGNPLLRIGISTNKKSQLTTSKAQRK